MTKIGNIFGIAAMAAVWAVISVCMMFITMVDLIGIVLFRAYSRLKGTKLETTLSVDMDELFSNFAETSDKLMKLLISSIRELRCR